MPRQDLAFGSSPGPLLSRLLWPIGILFAATLAIVLSTIVWTSDSVNEIAAERQRVQLSAAIDEHLGTLQDRLLDFAAYPGIFDDPARFGEQARARREFDGLVLLDPDWAPVAGMFDGVPVRAGHVPRLRKLAQGLVAQALSVPSGQALSHEGLARPRSSVSARLLFDGYEPYAALAVPVDMAALAPEGGSRRVTLLAMKYFDTAALRRIAVIHDVDRFQVSSERPADAGAALPIRTDSGEVAAYMGWTSARPGDLMRRRLLPPTLAGFAVLLLLFALAVAYLRRLARHLSDTEARSRDLLGRDPLSGLANRLRFGERLDRELDRLRRREGALAVVFIDLDRFKDVNDTFGHQAGDTLIQLVAQRLKDLVQPTDTIARFGGDEFAVIQTPLTSPEDSSILARRILEALTRPFALAHSQVTVGASIGIAMAPRDADTRESLMGLADTALYQAKTEGRNRFCVFQSRMDETIRLRKVVEEDLRRAIAEDQLVLHYQPLFSADGLTVVAVEALVRWPHPVRGMISPGEFIPIAEERGLVIPLGDWVLRQACRDGRRWPGIRVAVNVSPIQFRQRDFVANVVAHLDGTGFDPSRLELELTEGVVVEDADAAESAMIELRGLGIHLALDDFGTGYSSLIYLRRFAFDTIKIDRSFLESMEATGESAILVHSMVHLGRALGLMVTAEGVETVEQHRFLQALGCHQLQGFLFSRPVPAAQIDVLLGIGTDAGVEAAAA